MIVFPTNPIVDQIFTNGNRSWRWNGFGWEVNSGSGETTAPPTTTDPNTLFEEMPNFGDPYIRALYKLMVPNKVFIANSTGELVWVIQYNPTNNDLEFTDPNGVKLAMLDREGNFHAKKNVCAESTR